METITSRKNEKIVHLRRLGSDRKYRYEQRQFICDGEKLLLEAVSHGARVLTVLTSEKTLPDIPGAEVFSVSRDMIDYVSPLKTAQSVLFSCQMPEGGKTITGGSVILENIQDPGNVGTMIRTANAFGIKSVMLLGDCADVYNPKTVRASMGAVFRQSICRIDYDDIETLRAQGVKIYGAALGDDCMPIDSVELDNCAAAIGNEGSDRCPHQYVRRKNRDTHVA